MKKNILNKTRKMKGFFSTILLCSLMSFFVIGNAKNNESELNDNSDVLASNENETKVVRNAPTVPAWNNPDILRDIQVVNIAYTIMSILIGHMVVLMTIGVIFQIQ